MEGRSIIPIPELYNRDLEESEYLKIFNNNYNFLGGGFDDIKVYNESENYQKFFRRNNSIKGAGLFSFLSSVAKKSLPFLKKYIFPEAINFGTSLLEQSNTSKGVTNKNLKDLSKKSFKNIARKVIDSGGYKSRRKNKRKKKSKKNIYKLKSRKAKSKNKIKIKRKRKEKINLKKRERKHIKKSKKIKSPTFKIFEDI